MGKAADRRKNRRQQFLSKLAAEDPERFEREWRKRVDSWASEICVNAKTGEISSEPVFGIADRALETLLSCGEEAVALQFSETKQVLDGECCQGVASNAGRAIYDVSQRWNFEKR